MSRQGSSYYFKPLISHLLWGIGGQAILDSTKHLPNQTPRYVLSYKMASIKNQPSIPSSDKRLYNYQNEATLLQPQM